MNGETQMTEMVKSLTGASPTRGDDTWKTLKWSKINAHVFRLQVRIAKAEREGRRGKVKALQRLLTSSFSGKILAIKRVTSGPGSKTPGIDRIVWRTTRQKMKALSDLKRKGYKPLPFRRIEIPKRSGKSRPLSIPTLKDRAMQTLWYLALVPVAEEWADPNAYGFRPNRSTHDAIDQCFKALSRGVSAEWVLEGDIKSCFDQINHNWLLENIPMDKSILKKFLKAGFMKEGKFHKTISGTPQGSTISPTLALMTLSGLEGKVVSDNTRQKKKEKINVISYADDFVVTASSKSLLEEKVIPTLQKALQERGLELSAEKSKITHITQGFEFLGFNIRKYPNGKLLIKPEKAKIRNFLKEIKHLIKCNGALPTDKLIHLLNPKIRGWSTYYRSVVASKTFAKVDHEIYCALWRWGLKRHANKGKRWIAKKYYTTHNNNRWRFHCTEKDKKGNTKTLLLRMARETLIRRHKKIKAEATPFDPQFKDYFSQRVKDRKKEVTINKPQILPDQSCADLFRA